MAIGSDSCKHLHILCPVNTRFSFNYACVAGLRHQHSVLSVLNSLQIHAVRVGATASAHVALCPPKFRMHIRTCACVRASASAPLAHWHLHTFCHVRFESNSMLHMSGLAHQRDGCGAGAGRGAGGCEEAEAGGNPLQDRAPHRIRLRHVQQPAGGRQVRGRHRAHRLRHPRDHQKGAAALHAPIPFAMLLSVSNARVSNLFCPSMWTCLRIKQGISSPA